MCQRSAAPMRRCSVKPGHCLLWGSWKIVLTLLEGNLDCRGFGRGRSSVGRAPEWHSGGQGFESPRLHQPKPGHPLPFRRSRILRKRRFPTERFRRIASCVQWLPSQVPGVSEPREASGVRRRHRLHHRGRTEETILSQRRNVGIRFRRFRVICRRMTFGIFKPIRKWC